MKPWMKSALRVLLALAIVAGIVWFFGIALYVNRPKPVTGNIGLELQRISLPSLAMRVFPKKTLITPPVVMPAKAGIQYLPE